MTGRKVAVLSAVLVGVLWGVLVAFPQAAAVDRIGACTAELRGTVADPVKVCLATIDDDPTLGGEQ